MSLMQRVERAQRANTDESEEKALAVIPIVPASTVGPPGNPAREALMHQARVALQAEVVKAFERERMPCRERENHFSESQQFHGLSVDLLSRVRLFRL